jgi:Peptidase propeptide and YPEB domain
MNARAINARTLIIAAAVAMLVLVGAGIAYAAGSDSGEQQATGPGIEKAKSVALDHTNGGRVTGTEIDDEEGYYEVEVTRDDGSQVDVHLDRNFNVINSPSDNESHDNHDSANDSGG